MVTAVLLLIKSVGHKFFYTIKMGQITGWEPLENCNRLYRVYVKSVELKRTDSYIVLFYSAGALKALYTRCHIDPFTVFYAFQCLLTIILGYLACRLRSQGTNHQPSTQQMTCPTSWATATPRKSVINCAVGTPPQRELMRWWWDVVMRTLEPRITSWLQPMGKTKKPRTPGCCVRNIHESLHQCPELKWRSSISQPVASPT